MERQPDLGGEKHWAVTPYLDTAKWQQTPSTAHDSNELGRGRIKDNDDTSTDIANKGSPRTGDLIKCEDDDQIIPAPMPSVGRSDFMHLAPEGVIGDPLKNRRGPFKKRLSPHPHSKGSALFPPPLGLLRSETSSSFYGLLGGTTTPLLRQSSSSFSASLYMHHGTIPPPLLPTTSLGQRLMEAPLVETPQALPPNGERKLVSTVNACRAESADRVNTPALLPVNNDTRNRRCAISGSQRYSYSPHFFPFRRGPSAGNFGRRLGLKTEADTNLWMPQRTSILPTSRNDARRGPHPPTSYRAVVTDTRSMGPQRSPLVRTSLRTDQPRLGNTRSMDPSPKKAVVEKRIRVPNPLESRRELFENVPMTTRPCKCGSTQCLKLYCECFRNGAFCDPNLCNCTQCMNTEKHSSVPEPRGPRVTSILGILARRPGAFDCIRRSASMAGCRCKKSGYVSCFVRPQWLSIVSPNLTS
jgi:Tesmin/TSO1-like CXC domain, cysteine-rich domain